MAHFEVAVDDEATFREIGRKRHFSYYGHWFSCWSTHSGISFLELFSVKLQSSCMKILVVNLGTLSQISGHGIISWRCSTRSWCAWWIRLSWPRGYSSADLASATFQKLKELAMSLGNWMKMNHSNLILEVAVVLEVECVVVAELLAQEELLLLQV